MIIAVSGKSNAGKTTFADLAVEEFGATKFSFGSAVKEEVLDFLTLIDVQIEYRNLWGTQTDKEESFQVDSGQWGIMVPKDIKAVFDPHIEITNGGHTVSLTFRKLLQLWGTDYRRAQDPLYWVKRLQERIIGVEGLIVIDDVRFIDEAEMVEDCFGVLVRVDRPVTEWKEEHESETQLDAFNRWNWMILNTGTLEDYKNEVRRCLEVLA